MTTLVGFALGLLCGACVAWLAMVLTAKRKRR